MTTLDQNEAREAWENYAKSEGLVYDMPNSSERRAFMAGWRPPLSTPEVSDDEREVRVAAVTAVGDLDWSPKFGKSDLASAPSDEELANTAIDAYLAARRSPVPADTPSEDGPHSRACGPRKHDHGTDCHPNCQTCHGQAAPPTPPEDAVRLIAEVADGNFEDRSWMIDVIERLATALAARTLPEKPGRLDPEWRADLVDAATHAIKAVWADVPEGVDAETLAQNVVSTQEFLWLSRQFPTARPLPETEEWEYALRTPGGGIYTPILGEDVDTVSTPVRRRKAGPWSPIPEGSAD